MTALRVLDEWIAGCSQCMGRGQVPTGEPYSDNGPMQDLAPCDDCADPRQARAAVAELVEAAKRANGDHTAPHDCYATGPMTGNPIADLVACPGCALNAALAAFEVSK